MYNFLTNAKTKVYLESLVSKFTKDEGPRIGITTLDVINRIRELEGIED
jgi:hypothetical protein